MLGHHHLLLGAACYLALWRHPVSTPLGQLGAPVLGGPSLDGTPSLALIGTSLALASASALGPDLDKAGGQREATPRAPELVIRNTRLRSRSPG